MLYVFPEGAKYTYMTPTLFASGVGLQPTKVSAAQYLEYARSDVRDNSDRGLINALGNAKRAFISWSIQHYKRTACWPTPNMPTFRSS